MTVLALHCAVIASVSILSFMDSQRPCHSVGDDHWRTISDPDDQRAVPQRAVPHKEVVDVDETEVERIVVSAKSTSISEA
jgi:hypothetical protein